MDTLPPPNPLVKKHLLKGIDFSNELLYTIEEITKKYNVHISQSIKMGHFHKLDKSMTYVCKHLVEYKKQHEKFIREYNEYEKKYSYPSTSERIQPKL